MILKRIIVIHIHPFIIFSELILLSDGLFMPCHCSRKFIRREYTVQRTLLWLWSIYYHCWALRLESHIGIVTVTAIGVLVVTSEVRLGVHCWRGRVQGVVRGKVHSSVQRDTVAKGINRVLKGFWQLDGWSVACSNLEPWNLGCGLRGTYLIYLRQRGCRVLMIEYALSRQPLIFECSCIYLLLHQWSCPSYGCPMAVISHKHWLIRIVNISCLIEWSQHLLL